MNIPAITAAVVASPMLRYNWKDRGQAPLGYTVGMAVVFAECYAKLGENEAVDRMAAAVSDNIKDVLHWYGDKLPDMNTPADRLRNLFILLTGLGMRESSGRYCEGRDHSVPHSRVTADNAEAGLFQMSWDIKGASPLVPKLFQQWKAAPIGDGYMAIFKQGVTATSEDLRNWGTPSDGTEFQRLNKTYPLFAVMCAGICLRTLRPHWGPLNRKEVQIIPALDELYRKVQEIVDDEAEGITEPVDRPVEQPTKPPHTAAWPPAPPWAPLVSNDARGDLYGHFRYRAAPEPGNKEAIKILDHWEEDNIVFVELPQMQKRGIGRGMYFHKRGVNQLKKMFEMWEKAGLIDRILTFEGSFVPRFVRNSTTSLSNHSFGCAFDINYDGNQLGAVPALAGDRWSVRELVPIANECGFYWGGHYSGRKDGMHFELTRPEGPPIEVRNFKWAQAALNKLGFGPLTVDGLLGPKSKAALKAFQAKAGIVVDGLFGPQTIKALEAALKALEGPPSPFEPAPNGEQTANPFGAKPFFYVIGAEEATGRANAVTEVPWDADAKLALGETVHYRNLLSEEKDEARYGPFLKGDDVADAYGEGQIDPNSDKWMLNIDDQIQVTKALGINIVEWDNPDAKGQKIVPDVVKALDASAAAGLQVVAKNAALTDDPVTYLKHPTVVAHVIERGSGDHIAAQRHRIAAGKPNLPTWFVFHGRDAQAAATKLCRDIRTLGRKFMGVSWSPDGEYTSAAIMLAPLT